MSVKLDTLDPSALPVAYSSKSETVTLPGGVVSLTGITLVTGGAELSCGSCMMAFSVLGTLIGVSVVAVGLWDQQQNRERTSHLLVLGLVILITSFAVVGSVVGFRLLTKRRRKMKRQEREDGRVVLIEEGGRRVIKTVTA
ncbi:hypothetical protein DPEC_G00143440 [Dallia pectoralis]|uniref:Uncharacterized protein n=1 Tax=Dallia pectoralis TaxID=75939 RepID=A0ACC2GMY2_DALPE|nr:hypothetical protein DPEC_G00143440 [Dallia pectoralis]